MTEHDRHFHINELNLSHGGNREKSVTKCHVSLDRGARRGDITMNRVHVVQKVQPFLTPPHAHLRRDGKGCTCCTSSTRPEALEPDGSISRGTRYGLAKALLPFFAAAAIERGPLRFRPRNPDIDVHFGGFQAPGLGIGGEGVELDFGVLVCGRDSGVGGDSGHGGPPR